MMIENEFFPKPRFEDHRDQINQVGWIAGVNDIEAVPAQDTEGVEEFPRHRGAVFGDVGEFSDRLDGQRMAIDVDAVEKLVGLGCELATRADHRHLVACRAQSLGLHPNTAVEWHGEILDNHQDAPRRRFHRAGAVTSRFHDMTLHSDVDDRRERDR